jgi:hypothetical protein
VPPRLRRPLLASSQSGAWLRHARAPKFQGYVSAGDGGASYRGEPTTFPPLTTPAYVACEGVPANSKAIRTPLPERPAILATCRTKLRRLSDRFVSSPIPNS